MSSSMLRADVLAHVPPMELPPPPVLRQANGLDLPAVVINMPKRQDRWDAISGRMAGIGFDRLIRAPAVVGAALEKDRIAQLLQDPGYDVERTPESHLALTRPAIGCFLSHLAIWRWVVAHDLPQVLVFEDDANPLPGFDSAHFGATLDRMTGRTGLLFVGRLIMAGLADRPAGDGWGRLYYFNGTFAYVVTPAACRTLLASLYPLRMHIDHQISSVLMRLRADFPAYTVEPPFFEPDWSLRSDCYVPLAEDTAADRELGRLLSSNRDLLLGEGRPLRDAA
jgi:hypothetical protein